MWSLWIAPLSPGSYQRWKPEERLIRGYFCISKTKSHLSGPVDPGRLSYFRKQEATGSVICDQFKVKGGLALGVNQSSLLSCQSKIGPLSNTICGSVCSLWTNSVWSQPVFIYWFMYVLNYLLLGTNVYARYFPFSQFWMPNRTCRPISSLKHHT